MLRSLNRKLLVSVYTPQEAREAILGGGRIVDSEDPKSALGNISPLKIMAIRDAVLDYARDLDVQLSTNIGEDQLIFRRTSEGRAVQKSEDEIAGKAAQAALGVALSMGTEVHPCSIVKVGLDAMHANELSGVLSEVVHTLRRTPSLKQCPVMSVLFAQDLEIWNQRKTERSVRAELVSLREFSPASARAQGAFHLNEFWSSLRDADGQPLPALERGPERLELLKAHGVLPGDAADDLVVVNELLPHHLFFPNVEPSTRTNVDAIRAMVDITAAAGADAMMLDTSVLSKVSNVCLVDTNEDGMTHLSPFLQKNGLAQRGILKLPEVRFFIEYAHFKGIVPNIAGSVDSIQAQQLWALLPALDQISTRGAASGTIIEPGSHGDPALVDTRRLRTIVRQLVRGLAPPEHGGCLNLPVALRDMPDAQGRIHALIAELTAYREANGLPDLHTFYVDSAGSPSPPPADSSRGEVARRETESLHAS